MNKPFTIAIDFDGTVVHHEFPDMGPDVPGAADVLRELTNAGHNLILWTMRSDGRSDGDFLAPAVAWYHQRGIPLFGVQTNPTQHHWTGSPKAFAQLYIDDAALGCPLLPATKPDGKPYVDWVTVRQMLVEYGLLPDEKYP